MDIGINMLLWTTSVDDTHMGTIQKLKEAGFDGVEIPIFDGDASGYHQLGRRLSDMGLRATCTSITPDEERNPMSPVASHRQAGIDHLKWLIDCADALGAEVVGGPFYQPLAMFSGYGPTDAEWEHLVHAHVQMAAHAQPTGIQIAVEPLNRFECYALNTADSAAKLVRQVGAANYGYLYDTFHFNIEEKDPILAIDRTISEIAHVHISENDRGAPGRGHIDFRSIIPALKAGGYDGWLTIESFGHAMPDIAAATKIWRPIFDSYEQVYTEGIALIRECWD